MNIKQIEIKIRCEGSHSFSLNELNIFQDVDGEFQLKELAKDDFEGLKTRLEKKGFWFPFFIWIDKNEKVWYLDGTQRDKVLNWMRKYPSRYKLPAKYPCARIEAENETEAAEAILTQSTSYGRMTAEGLYGFSHRYGLVDKIPTLKDELGRLDGVDLYEFDEDWLKDNPLIEDNIKEKEIDENIETENECPKCGYKW